jgi:predicted ester cyclase
MTTPDQERGPALSTASLTENAATFRRVHEVTNTHDATLISATFHDVFAADVLIHLPLPVPSTGVQALHDLFAQLHDAFPDLHITVEDTIAEGDKVVGRNSITGTHRGDYMGLSPTGKRVVYGEIFIFRFAEGQVAEIWGVVDVVAQLRQLGALPDR